jgi:hypothetical protein
MLSLYAYAGGAFTGSWSTWSISITEVTLFFWS